MTREYRHLEIKASDRPDYLRQWKAMNRDRVKELNSAWDAANPDKVRASKIKSRQQPHVKAQRAAYNLDYKARIPDYVRKRDMVRTAKFNAAKRGVEFRLTVDDLTWPTHCPVLGIKLNYGKPSNGRGSDDSPSLDRHIPSLGYTPGNVVVMSWRANRLKCDGTVEEFHALIEYLRKTRSN